MIRDVTGIKLTPGNMGRDCLGDGRHFDKNGRLIERCCDECNFYMCCIEEHDQNDCKTCEYFYCPRVKNKVGSFFRLLRGWYTFIKKVIKQRKKRGGH